MYLFGQRSRDFLQSQDEVMGAQGFRGADGDVHVEIGALVAHQRDEVAVRDAAIGQMLD